MLSGDKRGTLLILQTNCNIMQIRVHPPGKALGSGCYSEF